MNHSEDISSLAAALARAQPVVKTALMDSTNPFFKSKYADLGAVWDAVRDALKTYDLAIAQFPDNIAGAPALTTMLIHASGQWISGTYPLMVTDKDHTPQGYGSALTYARRYGLSAVMGVIADTDDDGNATSRPAAKQTIAEKHAASLTNTLDRTEAAKAWAFHEIPRIKTFDKAALDKFCERFAKAREELKTLDKKTSTELEKAIDDRLEALFA